ncbi:MAG: type I-D CRISPR-associated protein Csc2, partial [Clostridia bacterium]|nr:type I-D CRISPR-associated protein Csc2 [Clostridia bacterium]
MSQIELFVDQMASVSVLVPRVVNKRRVAQPIY